MKPKGDTAINRVAQAGYTQVLFQGQWWALSREFHYGTRLDKATGKRRIVRLLV